MTDASEWPLPSQSRRVRLLLYLAEGLIVGGALPFVLAIVAGATVAVYETVVVNPTVTAAGVVGFLLGLYLLIRGAGIIAVARRSSREEQPGVRDWTETRRWRWVAAVALAVAALLVAASMALGREWVTAYRRTPRLLVLGTIGAGFLLKLYVLHRVGAKVV